METKFNRIRFAIMEFTFKFMLFLEIIAFLFFIATEVKVNRYKKSNGFTASETIYNDLQKNDSATYKVYDVIVNNPRNSNEEYESMDAFSYTLTVDMNGKAEFLNVEVPIRGSNFQGGLMLDPDEGVIYTDTPNQDGYEQYVEIRNQDGNKKIGPNISNRRYLKYTCRIYLNNLIPGENEYGKFGSVQAGKIGK